MNFYLNIILDLYGKRPVTYEYSDHNDNTPVFNTFIRLAANPGPNLFFIQIEDISILPKSFARRS